MKRGYICQLFWMRCLRSCHGRASFLLFVAPNSWCPRAQQRIISPDLGNQNGWRIVPRVNSFRASTLESSELNGTITDLEYAEYVRQLEAHLSDDDSSPISQNATAMADHNENTVDYEMRQSAELFATELDENGARIKEEEAVSDWAYDLVDEMDEDQARELDGSVSVLSSEIIPQFDSDMEILPMEAFNTPTFYQSDDVKSADTFESAVNMVDTKTARDRFINWVKRRLNKYRNIETAASVTSSPADYQYRINRDMRHISISIAACVDNPEEWRLFCSEDGGVDSLMEAIILGSKKMQDNSLHSGLYDWEEPFRAATTSSRALRDVCAISPELSAVITDHILASGKGQDSQNFIDSLVTLLQHTTNIHRGDTMYKLSSNGELYFQLCIECHLYILQLLLTLAITSDEAVSVLRATTGLVDVVKLSSSYREKGLVEKVTASLNESNKATVGKPQVKGVANKLLAALGINIWRPKVRGQKGIRILCLDGGGTRGITAVTILRSIVDAMGGAEVCDTFDMIAGTSTGAIIAFLVGLRRESSELARKRYDALIKRIFVKSTLSTPMLLFTTATYDEAPFMEVMQEILGDKTMLDSRADPNVPLVFAISSKMSSNPTQLCLFRNYNYDDGTLPDNFVIDPNKARQTLELDPETDAKHNEKAKAVRRKSLKTNKFWDLKRKVAMAREKSARCGTGSRHPGSFRVPQKVALRASTAAPTVFKPLLMGGELYCDGGIVASNPTAVAIHEARMLFPDIPIELVVSCGTGGFYEQKNVPRIGWDGIIGQIVSSATDAEATHHVLEDVLGESGTVSMSSSVSQTKYFRLNPLIGSPDDFPIDGTDPEQLEELSKITKRYLEEEEQASKLNKIASILHGRRRWNNFGNILQER